MTTPTETDPTTPPARKVDLLDELTVGEIDAGSRELGTSLIQQITTQGDRYEKALAVVLWLHLRRADRTREPKALLAELTGLRFAELSDRLTELADQIGAQEDTDPLASRSA